MSCCGKKSAKTEELAAATPFKSTMRTSMAKDHTPSFEEVIQGQYTIEPWIPSTFLEFLHAERNEENFFFYEEVEAFKALLGKSQNVPPENLLLLPGTVRKNPKEYAEQICETFVKEDAPRQVNISSDQRVKVLNQISAAIESQGYESEIFVEAQTEVKKLMATDSWPRFRHKMISENVSKEDGDKRFRESVFFALLALLGLGLMLGLYAPRWCIFILALPLESAFEGFFTYKMSFCARNAMRGMRDILGSTGDKKVIACPFVKMKQRQKARVLIGMVVVATIITTGFFFSLTYIIEAGVGRTLYG